MAVVSSWPVCRLAWGPVPSPWQESTGRHTVEFHPPNQFPSGLRASVHFLLLPLWQTNTSIHVSLSWRHSLNGCLSLFLLLKLLPTQRSHRTHNGRERFAESPVVFPISVQTEDWQPTCSLRLFVACENEMPRILCSRGQWGFHTQWRKQVIVPTCSTWTFVFQKSGSHSHTRDADCCTDMSRLTCRDIYHSNNCTDENMYIYRNRPGCEWLLLKIGVGAADGRLEIWHGKQ